MTSLQEVLGIISPFLNRRSSMPVNLFSGLGRVLANDVHSRCLIPPHDISNIEGYAVSSEDIENLPMTLNIIGRSTPKKIFHEPLSKGSAIKVFNGCPVPSGADAIIPIDKVEKFSSSIIINEPIMQGQNISIAGIDINDGDIILKSGTLLTARHVALASLTDVPWLPVVKRPRIGIITNIDNDLMDAKFTYIQQKNGEAIKSFLAAFIEARGGKATNLGSALNVNASGKQILNFKQELKEALDNVDMLVVIGGLHLADENLMWTSLSQEGANLDVIDVEIGQGEKIVVGHKNDVPIIGLSDHNVASLICALLFLKPAIEKLLGITDIYENKIFAVLDRDLDEFDKATDYLYARLNENEEGEKIVSPISAQDSLMISVLTNTNCLIVVDKKSPLKAGTAVEVIMFTGSIIST